MLGVQTLDLIIGLVLVFLLFSIASSAVSELIESILRNRSKDLKRAIEGLVGVAVGAAGAGVAPSGAAAAGAATVVDYQALLRHPLIRALEGKSGSLPSYIPARTFATALLDIVKGPNAALTLYAVQTGLRTLNNPTLKVALESLLDETVKDLSTALKKVEVWFDDTMDRASGWYKRRSQWILLTIGLLLVSLANADAVMIGNTLWQNQTVREQTVALAENVTPAKLEDVKPIDLQKKLTALNLLGWSNESPRDLPDDEVGWLTKVMGLVVSAAAVTQGAPFWFDLLNKLVNLRAAGKEPPKTKTDEKAP